MNNFEKMKKVVKTAVLAGVASSIPHNVSDVSSKNEKAEILDNKNHIEAQADTSENKINKDTVYQMTPADFSHNEISANESQKHFESFMSLDSINEVNDMLKERFAQTVMDTNSKGALLLDHALLALGTEKMLNGMSVNEYIDAMKDSAGHSTSKIDANNDDESFHPKSIVYSLMRSGVYDKWKNDGNLSHQADSVLEKAKNFNRNSWFSGHDYEWKLLTYVECAKRGLDTSFIQIIRQHTDSGTVVTKEPLNVEELYKLNEDEFLVGNDKNLLMERQKDAHSQYNDSFYEPTYGGAEALQSIIAYDIFSKDSVKLANHLKSAKESLEKRLNNDSSPKNTQGDISNSMNSIAHGILPFTEFPEDYQLDPETKKLVQEAIKKLHDFGEQYCKIPNTYQIYDQELGHSIDVLNHLNRSVLEK